MKTYRQSTRAGGFTLIELLVVITIVAVLAAMSFAGINAAIKKARSADAETSATAIKQAVERFEQEYNRLPEVQSSEVSTDQGPGVELLRVLLAEEQGSGSDLQNKRKIRFLSGKETDTPRGGIYYGSGANSSVQGMYDPFGNPYIVVLNDTYEDRLEFSVPGQSGGQYQLRDATVAVYTAGADKEFGTEDDITTFER